MRKEKVGCFIEERDEKKRKKCFIEGENEKRKSWVFFFNVGLKKRVSYLSGRRDNKKELGSKKVRYKKTF